MCVLMYEYMCVCILRIRGGGGGLVNLTIPTYVNLPKLQYCQLYVGGEGRNFSKFFKIPGEIWKFFIIIRSLRTYKAYHDEFQVSRPGLFLNLFQFPIFSNIPLFSFPALPRLHFFSQSFRPDFHCHSEPVFVLSVHRKDFTIMNKNQNIKIHKWCATLGFWEYSTESLMATFRFFFLSFLLSLYFRPFLQSVVLSSSSVVIAHDILIISIILGIIIITEGHHYHLRLHHRFGEYRERFRRCLVSTCTWRRRRGVWQRLCSSSPSSVHSRTEKSKLFAYSDFDTLLFFSISTPVQRPTMLGQWTRDWRLIVLA